METMSTETGETVVTAAAAFETAGLTAAAPVTPVTPTTPTTLGEAISRHGIDVDGHLDRQALIPVLAGLQAQGDVLVVPRPQRKPAETEVLRDGVAVVRGEFGGNTHTLLAEGDVRFDAVPEAEESLDLGVLTVAEGAVAYLAHPEHAYSGIAPGTYVLRRQREVDTARTLPQPALTRVPTEPQRPQPQRAYRFVRD